MEWGDPGRDGSGNRDLSLVASNTLLSGLRQITGLADAS